MRRPGQAVVVAALGITQILGWGTSFYFPAVLAAPIVADTGWSLGSVVGGTTIGLLVAGLASPRAGTLIGRYGGRPVLAAGSVLFAAGLCMVALSHSLPAYWAAWVLIGLGMAASLYDAVFAALSRLYGTGARGPITAVTLFGGLASTVCWPLSAVLTDAFGWRGACLIYAGLHLALSLPLQWLVLRPAPGSPRMTHAEAAASSAALDGHERRVFVLCALVFMMAATIGSILIVHLPAYLQALGASATGAVAIAALLGPGQVSARLLEFAVGRRWHPIATMLAAASLMAAGLLLLPVGPLAVAVFVFAAGNGIAWVARGTLPLAIFGAVRYPRLIGRLAFPSLMIQALGPSLGALLIETQGAAATVSLLAVLAAANVALSLWLWRACAGMRG